MASQNDALVEDIKTIIQTQAYVSNDTAEQIAESIIDKIASEVSHHGYDWSHGSMLDPSPVQRVLNWLTKGIE